MRGKTAIVAVTCLVTIVSAVLVRGASGDREQAPAYREGEVLVRFRPGSDEQDRTRARNLVRTRHVKRYKHVKIEKLTLEPEMTAAEAIALLRSHPDVEYAELNWYKRYLAVPRVEPGDPRYTSGEQWHLDAPPLTGYHVTTSRPVSIDRDIDAPEAWAVMSEVFTTAMSGAVGVIDTGCGDLGYFDSSTGYIPNHEDLPNGSLWANTVELATPGVDDDSNGYVDDVNGWDFTDNDNIMDDDDWPHGTFISGIIAAAWDNSAGGAGVGKDRLKVVPLKTFLLSEDIESIEYAIDMASGDSPIRVLNASWAYPQPSPLLQDAIELAGAAGIAFVAAASNEANNNDLGAQAYPAEYTKVPLDNVLAVAASDSTGGLAYFSNYGPFSVQIAAPGQDYLSAYLGTNQYTIDSGTSFAAPVAASALALIMSANPGLIPAEAIDRLIEGGDFDARLSGLVRSGKRVNLAGALAPFVPYSGYAPMGTRQTVSLYGDSVSALYGSIINAISSSPSVAVMVTTSGGAWAVSPVSPGLTTFTLEFDGASAPVGTYETGTWRVTGISPFSAQVPPGQTLVFTCLIPYSTIDWSVSNPVVGTIDSGGIFTALNQGATRIILNIDGEDVDNSGVILVVSDGDGDGYVGVMDCNDTDENVNPDATEICHDRRDNNCDGDVDALDSTCKDEDEDGYWDGYEDCDDTDPDIHPGADEICDDGIDNDCDGDVDMDDSACQPSVDGDGDGYDDDVDCDDTDPDVNPGTDEICDDGIDNDCDGDIDTQDSECEADGDGGSSGGGCGATAPSPDDPAWPRMVMISMLTCLMLLVRKRHLEVARIKVKG
jgi:hypothetical protein